MAQGTNIRSASIKELHREIRRRQRRASALERRREGILAKVAAIDEQIGMLMPGSNGRLRK